MSRDMTYSSVFICGIPAGNLGSCNNNNTLLTIVTPQKALAIGEPAQILL